jgi:hypothetical protein
MGAETLEEVGPKKLLLQSTVVNGRWSTREEAAGNCFSRFLLQRPTLSLIHLVSLPLVLLTRPNWSQHCTHRSPPGSIQLNILVFS